MLFDALYTSLTSNVKSKMFLLISPDNNTQSSSTSLEKNNFVVGGTIIYGSILNGHFLLYHYWEKFPQSFPREFIFS